MEIYICVYYHKISQIHCRNKNVIPSTFDLKVYNKANEFES